MEEGKKRISTVVIPIKLSGSLLTQADDSEDEDDDEDDDEDVKKLYETDVDFYSSVSGMKALISPRRFVLLPTGPRRGLWTLRLVEGPGAEGGREGAWGNQSGSGMHGGKKEKNKE